MKIVPQENLRLRIKDVVDSDGHLEREDWDTWRVIYDNPVPVHRSCAMYAHEITDDTFEVLPCGK